MEIRELKAWAAHVRPDLPTARVVDVLVERYAGEGTTYSPALIAEGLPGDDVGLVLASLLLLTGPPSETLVSQWLFFDDEGEEHLLNAQDVEDAARTGEFFHPISGFPVFNFHQSIGLVYHPGPGLDEAMHGWRSARSSSGE